MSTFINHGRPMARPAPATGARAEPRRHWAWLGLGLVVGFLVPFVLADQLGMQRDLFYGVYVAMVALLFAGWMRDTGQAPREMLVRRWRVALVLSVVFAGLTVAVVLATEDATRHPEGVAFAGALLWRGLVYGAADGLLLTAFPILVVVAAMAGSQVRQRRGGAAVVGAIALAASLLMTATYHLGYSDFRSEKVRKPLIGDLLWSPPVLVTLNPLTAPFVHASMHVTAVAHSYDTDTFLPPH